MKDTLKTLEQLEQHIDRVIENGLYKIERDLLLERLRGIYATVVATEATSEEDSVLDAILSIGAPALIHTKEEPEIEIEQISTEENQTNVTSEQEAFEDEFIAESEIEEEVEEEAEIDAESIAETEHEADGAIDEEPIIIEDTEAESTLIEEEEDAEPAPNEEIDHAALLSLYDDDDDDAPEQIEEQEEVIFEEEPTMDESIEEETIDAEPEFEEDNKEEEITPEAQTIVLGDILATEQTTIADNLAEQLVADVASTAGLNVSLRGSIALNDKFILMRDLFAGNNDYYEMAIDRLDSFDNLEDAMLYIHDNFHWNPNSEGARLLMELLARKLF